jgi:hypothetical protein
VDRHYDIALGVGQLLDPRHALVADEDVPGIEQNLSVFLRGVFVVGLAAALRTARTERTIVAHLGSRFHWSGLRLDLLEVVVLYPARAAFRSVDGAAHAARLSDVGEIGVRDAGVKHWLAVEPHRFHSLACGQVAWCDMYRTVGTIDGWLMTWAMGKRPERSSSMLPSDVG